MPNRWNCNWLQFLAYQDDLLYAVEVACEQSTEIDTRADSSSELVDSVANQWHLQLDRIQPNDLLLDRIVTAIDKFFDSPLYMLIFVSLQNSNY